MKIILSILLFLFSIRTLSYGVWCLKNDSKNKIGGISVIILSFLVFTLCFLTGEIHG